MSRFFSSSAIASLESSSREKVLKLCQRLHDVRNNGKLVNLSNAFRCLAADSVTNYCMPKGFNLLDSIDFADDYNRQARTISYIAVWHRHIPIIIPIFMRMPRWFVKMSSTEGGLLSFDFQTVRKNQSFEARWQNGLMKSRTWRGRLKVLSMQQNAAINPCLMESSTPTLFQRATRRLTD